MKFEKMFAQQPSGLQSRFDMRFPRIVQTVSILASIGIIAIQWPAHSTAVLSGTKTEQVVAKKTRKRVQKETQKSASSLPVQIYLYGTDGSPINQGNGFVQEKGVYDAFFNLVGYVDPENPLDQTIVDVNGVVIGFYTLDTSPGMKSNGR